MSRGGKRTGAGRPVREIKKIQVGLKLEPEDAERLKAVSIARGTTQASILLMGVELAEQKQ
tara:strand:+ start:735 stop:917 length:183 start_codon:yes stop_codon:yes gene_type:complete